MSSGQRAQPTILLIGAGGLGGTILELLVREESLGRIVVAGRDAARGEARCNLARLGAMAQGYAPSVSFTPLDVRDLDMTAETIAREAPDLILSTATMQTWWLADLLPPRAALRRAGFGLWLPVHLALTLSLMEAVRAARFAGPTLTAPFPDVVNPALARLGLAPTCGIGNLDEIVPKIRLLAAERLAVPLEAVRVWLVAHHALEAFAFGEADADGEPPPYFLRVECGARDVTAEVGAGALLRAPYPLPPGPPTHFLTAGSAVRLVRALLSGRGALLHAPAPGGLPGGYPVIAGSDGVYPAPIAGLALEEAIAINERSHRFDGIERIEADGTIVFCPATAAVARETLGYDCDSLHPREAAARATELMARFRAYAARYGVELPLTHQEAHGVD